MFFSEHAMESVHFDFNSVWKKYKVSRGPFQLLFKATASSLRVQQTWYLLPWPTKSELRCAYYGRNKLAE
jgi:hypothetical protein